MSTDVEMASTVARLAAIEDIKQLKARYCEYCDRDYDPDGLAALFVEDAVWDGGPQFGRHEGREAIRGFFRGASGSIVFAAHLVMNPIIEIEPDGARASGRWRLFMPCTVKDAAGVPEARWLLSAYAERYARTAAGWRFAAMTVDTQFFSTHADGWAAESSA